jgi:actin-like ATPase involved in cell morphogenesis
MIVDIGGGTTEIAGNRSWRNCMWQISKIAGDVFTNDVYYMRTQHNYLWKVTEKIKIK